jgi:hypothetical protein
MSKSKPPEQLAEEYVELQIKAHPRHFPEWSSTDIEIAWYAGYEARDEEVENLKRQIERLTTKSD